MPPLRQGFGKQGSGIAVKEIKMKMMNSSKLELYVVIRIVVNEMHNRLTFVIFKLSESIYKFQFHFNNFRVTLQTIYTLKR